MVHRWDATEEAPTYRAEVAWERRYARRLMALDTAACLIAALLAYVMRFGHIVDFELIPVSSRPYILATGLLPMAWVLSMSLNRAYEPRFLGGGPEEFRRVLNAAARLTALVAIVSYATKAEIARAYLLIAFPAATVLSVGCRAVGRTFLHRMRRQGRCMHRVLVVGARDSAASWCASLNGIRRQAGRWWGWCWTVIPAGTVSTGGNSPVSILPECRS
jgi:FlaA1/EpsC-like NDP-sugar epimerase